ncbi:MAG: CPBP family intramembrane metalloprotease [Spirochaetales bacterium]|nr:CPBP family intramembrane metalloprotease [Spirochaetales bacterium]
MMYPRGEKTSFFDRFWLEPLLLFSILYLPGYLTQTPDYNRDLFDSVSFNLLYGIITLPQILFVIYLIYRREPGAFKEYGILPFRFRDTLSSTGILLCIYALMVPFFLILQLFLSPGEQALLQPGWQISRPALLPLILATCLLTGYSEELFFRAYLLTTLEKAGLPHSLSIFTSVLLFGLGHIYQGFLSFIGTSFIGIILTFFFIKQKNLHTIGIAHGLYNFSVLLLSLAYIPGS